MAIITNSFRLFPPCFCCDNEGNNTTTPTAEKFTRKIQIRKTYESSKAVTIPEGALTISIRPIGYTDDAVPVESSFKIDDVRHGIFDENNGEVHIDHTKCEQLFVPATTITDVVGKYRVRVVFPPSVLATDVTEAQLNALFNE